MSRRLLILALAGGLGLGGCAAGPCPPQDAAKLGVPDWQDIISDRDHERIRGWRKALVDSIAAARTAGFGPQIDARMPLFDPDVSIDDATLPVGAYRCQVTKLGTKTPGNLQYIVYPAHHCEVHAPGPKSRLNKFVETNGLQKPSGRLYPDNRARMIFLGTMILGDEVKPILYGRDEDRDMVASLQRIGEKRWRMLFPNPAWESTIDVMEITPE